MSHIDFNESNLNYLCDKSKQAAETFVQSSVDLHAVESETDAEFHKAISELSVEISNIVSQLDSAHRAKNSVEQKIADNKSRIQSVPEIPSAPSDSQAQQNFAAEKAKAEQARQAVERENAKCRAEITKLESSKRELETGISALDNCLQELQAAKSTLSSAQSNFNSVRSHNAGVFQKSVTDIGLFCNALSDTCARSEEVLGVSGNFGFDYWVLRKDFNINAVVYSSGKSGGLQRAETFASMDTSDTAIKVLDSKSRVCVIKERQREKVFELLENETGSFTVKIPAANLHSLGGQNFIEEMAGKSFVLIKKNGNIIGNDGYITWEK